MTDDLRHLLRRIPKVDRVIDRPEWAELCKRHGSAYAVDTCRKALGEAKERILSGESGGVETIVEEELGRQYLIARLKPLQPVVNATGVILHTNLGRAPFARDIVEELRETLSGACNLELDLCSGQRGVRGAFVRESIARLCAAEDALVVNNNAAGLLLSLSALAAGREVIVSRGELIQIGGGFRIPDVIQQGGARLREVGTTNITTLQDFRDALGPETGALLKVHLSNFQVGGFAGRPSTSELASLKTEAIPLIEDLGSGNMLTRVQAHDISDPTPSQALSNGADLVCFSGDKLLGGPQAGLIAGRRDLIGRLAKSPLMRAIRPDKIVYALLQATLRAYERGEPERLSPWRQLQQGRRQIVERIEAFYRRHGISAEQHPIMETEGEYGAGSLPGKPILSAALVVTDREVDMVAMDFRQGSPPVIGIVRDGAFLLDFLTIRPEDEPIVAEAIAKYSNR
jgi:L-seryl-tRNA(Ser) seleniumtransferase